MTTPQASWDGPRRATGFAASKVPTITVYFWIIKLLSTAMGEATSDYMVKNMNPVIAVILGFIAFAIAMVLQFRAKQYNAWIYWLAVTMVAVFGTMAADVLHIKFGVPYLVSTMFFAVVLAVVFYVWYRSEGTLSIHSIRTPRRETFYWATVLSTFALGTATGDMTAKTLSLGYLASGVLFSVAFLAVALAYWKFGLNPILGFWIAYVLTRPVGASYADYIAFPTSVGGLNTGHGPVALTLTAIIVALVAYMAATRKDVERAQDRGSAVLGADRGEHRPAGGYRDHPGEAGYRAQDGYQSQRDYQDQGDYPRQRGAHHRRDGADRSWSQPRQRPDQSGADQSRTERPRADQFRADESRADRSRAGERRPDGWPDQSRDSSWSDQRRPEPPWPDRRRPDSPRPDSSRLGQRGPNRSRRGRNSDEDDREPEGFFMWDDR